MKNASHVLHNDPATCPIKITHVLGKTDCLVPLPAFGHRRAPRNASAFVRGTYRSFIHAANTPMHDVLTLMIEQQRMGQNWVQAAGQSTFRFDSYGGTCGDQRKVAAALAKLAPPSATLLDAGMGVGSLDAAAAQLGFATVGFAPVERHPRPAQTIIAQERGLPALALAVDATHGVPAPSGSFDVVHCCWCWLNDAWWWREVSRLLRPGGVYAVDAHNSYSDQLHALCLKPHSRISGVVGDGKGAMDLVVYEREPGCGAPAEGGEALSSGVTSSEAPPPRWRELLRQIARLAPPVRRDAGEVVGALDANARQVEPAAKALRTALELWGTDDTEGVNVTVVSVSRRGTADAGGGGGVALTHDWCAAALQMNPRSFDAILFDDLLPYLRRCPPDGAAPRGGHVLLEMHRLLKPGGLLILTGRNELRLAARSLADSADAAAAATKLQVTALGCVAELSEHGGRHACVLRRD